MNDYDYDPKEAPSPFLRLKKQGDTITVRIASVPYREPTIWKLDGTKPIDAEEVVKLSESQWMAIYRDPDYNVNESFHWMVIDRSDGMAKIYSATPGVYKTIKEYAEMPEWGDPQGYDLKIERTEEPGRGYYKVTALPNKDPLTQRDLQRLTELKFEEKKPAARKLSERQLDYMEDVDQEFDEAADGSGVGAGAAADEEDQDEADRRAAAAAEPPKKKDVVIEDIGDKPINLDEIPF